MLWWSVFACVPDPEPPPQAPEPVAVPKKAAPRRAGRPQPKPCLPPPDAEGDAGMAASAGLTEEQVRAALSGVWRASARCVADAEAAPTGTMLVSVRVSCGGVVDEATVADAADWPEAASRCVLDALRGTPFPAHALPDGDTIQVPFTWRP